MTIGVLPDDVLLEIFDCYDALFLLKKDAWHTLVHVSRKWRRIVFDSPRRLNLRLLCSARTPARKMLTIWPPLPIILREHHYSARDVDNIIAALEQHNRVCDIQLSGDPSSALGKLLVAMEEPFPALANLELENKDDMAPVIPDTYTFLGGFAPRLGTLSLTGIPTPFPGLRRLFLSSTNLVYLSLLRIPHSGYISPEAMVTCLSALTRLEVLKFEFESPRSWPYRENRRSHPPTRTLLPSLRDLLFTGGSEYLDDLVARIDVPLLAFMHITFFHQLIFDTPQLAQFISRSNRRQKDGPPNEARVVFSDSRVIVLLPEPFAYWLELEISCKQSDWQLSALAQVCSSSFPRDFIPTVEHLYIILELGFAQLRWQHDIENSQWLELLHPFTGVKKLFLSQNIAPRIAPALQEFVGGRANEVLPALQSIHLEVLHPLGVVPEVIGQFVTARHLSGHPIAVIPW